MQGEGTGGRDKILEHTETTGRTERDRDIDKFEEGANCDEMMTGDHCEV